MPRNHATVPVDPDTLVHSISLDNNLLAAGAPTWRKRNGMVDIPDEKGKLQRYTTLKHPGTKNYFNIQAAMGLDEEDPKSKVGKAKSELFRQIRSKIRYEFKASMTMKEWETITWAQVGSDRKSLVSAEALIAQPYLRRFPNNWATEELMKRMLQNSRCSTNQKTKVKPDKQGTKAHESEDVGHEPEEEDSSVADNNKSENEYDQDVGDVADEEVKELGDQEEVSEDESGGEEGSEEEGTEGGSDEEEEPPKPVSRKGKSKQSLVASNTSKKAQAATQSSRLKTASTPLEHTVPQDDATSKRKTNNKHAKDTSANAPAASKKRKRVDSNDKSDDESDWEAHVEAEIAAKATLPVSPKNRKNSKKATAPAGPSSAGPSILDASAPTKAQKQPRPKMIAPVASPDSNSTATSSSVAKSGKSGKAPAKDMFDLSRPKGKFTPEKPIRRQAGRAAKSKSA